MNLSFRKKPKTELEAAEIELRAKLLEATVAAIEGDWPMVEDRIETARMLTGHVRLAEQRAAVQS